MAALSQLGAFGASTKPMVVNPQNSIYQALATGNQSGLGGAGTQSTNSALNNTFYQQGVANPWYQQNQAKLNRTGPNYQPGGMFYDPTIDGPGAGAPATGIGSGLGGGSIGAPPTTPTTGMQSGLGGGTAVGQGAAGTPASSAAYGGSMTSLVQPAGGVQSAAGGQPDWSKLDISKFLAPNIDFQIQQVTNAINNSAAAKGGLLSGNTLKGLSDYAQGTAENAYQNAQNAAFNDRNFMRGNFQNDRDYQTALDQWNNNFPQNQYQFNTGANQFQQQFGYNVDNADRQFGYNAMNNDRNFNSQLGLNLAQLGMQGSQQQNALNQWLGTLLANNNLSAGQTQGNAAIGGSNATNSAISQFLSQLLSNNLMNRYFPQQGGPQ